MYATLLLPMPLIGIEREHLRVQEDHAPDGHAVSGTHRHGEIWRCSCGLDWSDGVHPEPGAAQAEPIEQERAQGYPYDACVRPRNQKPRR